MSTAKVISISLGASLATIVVALLLHFTSPEILRFSDSKPPQPGEIYSAEALQQKEALAKREIEQAMATTPRLTVGGLVQSALARFTWAAAVGYFVVAVLLRSERRVQQALAAVPFVAMAVFAGTYWVVLAIGLVVAGTVLVAGSKNVAAGT